MARAGRRTTSGLHNRPLVVDEQRLQTFALAGCTEEEVAAALNLPVEQLHRDYGGMIERHRLVGAGLIRKKAFQKAVMDADPGLLRQLLVSYLGVSGDPQLRELRTLQIEEQRIKLERAKFQFAQEQAEAERRRWEEQKKAMATQDTATMIRRLNKLTLGVMSLEDRTAFLTRVRARREQAQPWTQSREARQSEHRLLELSELEPAVFDGLLEEVEREFPAQGMEINL